MQPLDFSNTSGHAMAFYKTPLGIVREYDEAEDGPEVGVIQAIRASHGLYIPGKEAELLKFQRFVDKVARAMYGKRYLLLGLLRKAKVRRKVVMLHVEGNGVDKY